MPAPHGISLGDKIAIGRGHFLHLHYAPPRLGRPPVLHIRETDRSGSFLHNVWSLDMDGAQDLARQVTDFLRGMGHAAPGASE